VATFDEAERAAARNTRDVSAHLVMVKADDRTSLPRNAKDQILAPAMGEGIGPDRDEPFPLTETTIHSWVD
jgi:chromosome partitioning protein